MADAFPPIETQRLATCLSRLLPGLDRDQVAVTGGVAIQLGLAALGHRGSRRAISDLDLVAGSIDAINAEAGNTLLVSHYHVAQPGVPKFMVQLVDPLTRVRIDVFPDLVGSISRSVAVSIGTETVNALSLEDIFEHKLQTLSRASPTTPTDPKHLEDATLLGELLGRSVPMPTAGSLAKEVYGLNEAPCARCDLSTSAGFRLAPKDQILSLLGWPLHEQNCEPRTVGATQP